MARGLHITTNGTIVPADLEDGLKDLQRAVGGWIECVSFTIHDPVVAGRSYTCDMWINEEGKLQGLPPNRFATRLTRDVIAVSDYIAGDVFITGNADHEGRTMSLSSFAEAAILHKFDEALQSSWRS